MTERLTTTARTSGPDNQNRQSVGPRGPVLLQDHQLIEKVAHQNRANIELYFDKEVSGHDLEDFHAHLEECEVCRTELEAIEELSGLLHRSRLLYSAPDALRKQVLRTLCASK